MPKGIPQWQYDWDVRKLLIDERAWLRMAVATLIDLTHWLMTEQENQQSSEQRILQGMADLLKDNSTDRHHQFAEILTSQRAIEGRVSYLSRQVEDMRRNMAGNIEHLSDRMHERGETSDTRYTEFVTRIQDAEARLTFVETEIADLKTLMYDIANHLPSPDEATNGA